MNNIAYFKKACKSGNITQVKLLIENYNIDIHADVEYAFRVTCEKGHLKIVKYLISLDQNINIHAEDEYAFKQACHNNYLDLVKYLISLNQNIDIHNDDEYAFRIACANGQFELVKYLISLNQNINIHANDEQAFRYACYYGNLELVKYLISLDENINIYTDDDCAFKNACLNNHKHVAEYLCSLTDKYSIKYENNKLTYVIQNYLQELKENYDNIIHLDIPKHNIYKHDMCCICLEEKHLQVLFSCNHMLCIMCYTHDLTHCMLCRKDIEQVLFYNK